jgi:glycosyltransferase involved in cell wall biosynthesis
MPVKTIGYMGFDHTHDLAMITPELVRILDKYQHIRFELFGTIPVPQELERFGDRISSHLPVRPYDAFLAHLTRLKWDIGLCPLEDTAFNRFKANNKWVEYTSTGAAVIATAGMAYDQCCGDGCGLLVSNAEGWFGAIDKLCSNPSLKLSLVENAQRRLQTDYSAESLREQILTIFDEAYENRKMARNAIVH